MLNSSWCKVAWRLLFLSGLCIVGHVLGTFKFGLKGLGLDVLEVFSWFYVFCSSEVGLFQNLILLHPFGYFVHILCIFGRLIFPLSMFYRCSFSFLPLCILNIVSFHFINGKSCFFSFFKKKKNNYINTIIKVGGYILLFNQENTSSEPKTITKNWLCIGVQIRVEWACVSLKKHLEPKTPAFYQCSLTSCWMSIQKSAFPNNHKIKDTNSNYICKFDLIHPTV